MDIPDIHIRSVGSALPGPPIDNSALARRFGMDALWEQWVDAFIGTRSRHLAIDLDSGDLAFSLTELAAEAGSRALVAAGLEPSEIDVLVMGTATPDQLMPATVNLVADRLGINDVPTYQLQSGCCGAVQALDVGRRMLQSAGHTNALVLGGDVCAQFFDLDADLMSLRPEELVNAVLFGDGAGAAVLTTESAPGRPAIRGVLNRLTGLGQEPGQVLRWYGPAQGKPPEGAGVAEDYKAIEERVPVMAAEIMAELLDALDWKPDDVGYLLPPQLSGRMTGKIVKQLNLPGAREITCVADTANTGNALPFLQLERLVGVLEPGERAIGIAVESSKWIKSGFALEGV
ncbi:3-oxoacyl-ACP synthase III family protein [Streptomyces sp. NPDC002225]|uniref:3-oxoacyl-ACP synthase III family protein n=1 Tax=Streptomyces sp. NPDC002225 TaxID=3154413 RepID=UPI003325B9D8